VLIKDAAGSQLKITQKSKPSSSEKQAFFPDPGNPWPIANSTFNLPNSYLNDRLY